MKLVIELPVQVSRSPNRTMGRSFWVYKNHKDKCAEILKLWNLALNKKSESQDWRLMVQYKLPRVHLHIESYRCRPMDADNCVAGCKAIIDIFRQEGYIIDDNPTMLSISVDSKKVGKKDMEKMVFTFNTQDDAQKS